MRASILSSDGCLQDLPQCGTNLAATDAVLTVQALVATEPPPDAVITAASKAAAAAVMSRFLEAAGLRALLKVRSFHPFGWPEVDMILHYIKSSFLI